MLPAEDFIVWALTMYLVVVTRDVASALMVAAFMFSDIYLVTGADIDVFALAVRRPAFAMYGGLSGYALAAALRTRTLVPVHAFSNTDVHIPGPLVLIGVAYGTYTLLGATGLATVASPLSDSAETALLATLFALTAMLVIAILVLSCIGLPSSLTFRYRDDESRANPVKATSQLAAEVVFASALVFAPSAGWIYLPRPPVNFPQWAAGLLCITMMMGGVAATYFLLRNRHGMDRVHFDREHSRVSWGAFCFIVGVTLCVTSVAWLIVAEFATTGFAAEVTLLALSGAVVVEAIAITLLPLRDWWRTSDYTYTPSRVVPEWTPGRGSGHDATLQDLEAELNSM